MRCPGQQIRPFIRSAGVTSHSCSLPLQRVMTDFGADHAFGQVPKKLREHYGIDLAVSTIRHITQHHGTQMRTQKPVMRLPLTQPGCQQQIGEIDGTMIPIVTVDEEKGDKRKQKTLHWEEARLALVHEKGRVTPKFDACFRGSVDDAGQALINCAVAANFGHQTHLHSVGDGAAWIAKQVHSAFGEQASYLTDFFHVCEYLSAAAKRCAPQAEKVWLEKQKRLLKNTAYTIVINNLLPCLEADDIDNDKAPVRACHRYLTNRTHSLDYRSAIEKDLPIGSGEIESAHRYVIQARLKIAGAWWKPDNVAPMLALRVVRANNDWDNYWAALAETRTYNYAQSPHF